MKRKIFGLCFGTLVLSMIIAFYCGISGKFDVNAAEEYKTNKDGLTYGSSMYSSSPESEPDLILAETLDGKEGYIYKEDLNYGQVDSPEKLLSLDKQNQKIWDNAPAGEVVVAKYIPVYKLDGKTIIGEFPITIGYKEKEDDIYPGQVTNE
jgi:hypothetical protein